MCILHIYWTEQVAELLGASPPPDLAADTGHDSEAVREGYLPPGTPLMAAVFASNTKAIGALLGAGADGSSGGPSHHMVPAETAAYRADPYALAALHKGGVDVTLRGPHGFCNSSLSLSLSSFQIFGRSRAT